MEVQPPFCRDSPGKHANRYAAVELAAASTSAAWPIDAFGSGSLRTGGFGEHPHTAGRSPSITSTENWPNFWLSRLIAAPRLEPVRMNASSINRQSVAVERRLLKEGFPQDAIADARAALARSGRGSTIKGSPF